MKDIPILCLLAFFKYVTKTNLGTEFKSVCLFRKLNMFLLGEKAICMSVKMALTTKKLPLGAFHLIQVLDTANKKRGPLFIIMVP